MRGEALRRLHGRLPTGLRRWTYRALAGRARLRSLPAAGASGLNLIGYFHGQFGLGESARLYARALIDAGCPVALRDAGLDISHGLDDHSLDVHLDRELPYDTHLVFINPDYMGQVLAAIDPAEMVGRRLIACWYWELEEVPVAWLPELKRVDGILVASTFVEQAFRKVTRKPVYRIPLPLGERADSGLGREAFGLDPGAFVFLGSFDFNSFVHRKHPAGVVEAFTMAFPASADRVQLLIKTSNGHRNPAALQDLLDAVSVDNRIIVSDGIMDRDDVPALQRCANAYVSLHRAEGFGLGMAECMRMGKPVIATRWSGNMDFMDDANSCLVDCTLVPVGRNHYPFSRGQRWAAPDIAQAAAWMQRLVREPGLAQRVGDRARADILERLDPSRIARQMMAALGVHAPAGLDNA
jgi:glycosyltransferase involved in cell wall biosynthesis